MSDQGKFLVYCLEMYRAAKNMSGREAFELFHKTGADTYVRKCFGALHTTGNQYIIDDLDGFINDRLRPAA